MVDFAQHYGCKLFDLLSPGETAGICHLLLPEQGIIHPGMIIAGTDSHSCTYGAFGSLTTGIGTTDMVDTLATGDMWQCYRVAIHTGKNYLASPRVVIISAINGKISDR